MLRSEDTAIVVVDVAITELGSVAVAVDTVVDALVCTRKHLGFVVITVLLCRTV